jgi:23S rRNA (pseudouridine1915-N3)-methyltransferase
LKFLVLAVGHRAPAWVDAGFTEYARRMPREAQLELIPVRPAARGSEVGRGSGTKKILEAEAKRIVAALPRGCFTVVLDQAGRSFTTEALAQRLAEWQSRGGDVAFVIGGADGLSEQLKQDAGFRWSLSALTLPHALVRVVLAEQLYRATSILKGHPYHRG